MKKIKFRIRGVLGGRGLNFCPHVEILSDYNQVVGLINTTEDERVDDFQRAYSFEVSEDVIKHLLDKAKSEEPEKCKECGRVIDE